MSFAILTDTSANLPTPLLQKHGVTVAPFSYSYDGAEHTCLDTGSFDGAAYYGAMRKGTVVTTSLVNPDRFISAARPLLAAGEDVLFVGMSSGISGSFGSAKLAAGDLREEFPGRDIQLVVHDKDILGQKTVPRRERLYAFAGKVHEGLRFGDKPLVRAARKGRLPQLAAELVP